MNKMAIFNLLVWSICISCGPQGNTTHKTALTEHEVASKTKEIMEKDTIKTDTPQEFGLDYIMGKFDPAQNPDFIVIPTNYADRPGLYLRKDTWEAYKQMYDSAKKDGVLLVIKSATRNFDYQKGIWEKKWKGITPLEDGTKLNETNLSNEDKALRILKYSSMPGTSRHHWGTDIDLNNFSNDYFSSGDGLKIKNWLDSHAHEFGFVQVYTPKGNDRPEGYSEERWHWSYHPISKLLINEAANTLKNTDITGFLGSDTASKIDVLNKYILGINKACF